MLFPCSFLKYAVPGIHPSFVGVTWSSVRYLTRKLELNYFDTFPWYYKQPLVLIGNIAFPIHFQQLSLRDTDYFLLLRRWLRFLYLFSFGIFHWIVFFNSSRRPCRFFHSFPFGENHSIGLLIFLNLCTNINPLLSKRNDRVTSPSEYLVLLRKVLELRDESLWALSFVSFSLLCLLLPLPISLYYFSEVSPCWPNTITFPASFFLGKF